MSKKILLTTACLVYFFAAKAQTDSAAMTDEVRYIGDTTKPQATEFYKPVPPIVTPGTTPMDAPSDAIILFSGNNLDAWRSEKDSTKPAGWTVSKDMFTVNKKAGGHYNKATVYGLPATS